MSLINKVSQKLRKLADFTDTAVKFWEQHHPANGNGKHAPRQLGNGAMTMDSPLLYLGTGDVIPLSELMEGVAVFGATGSGKSSSIGTLLALQLMAAQLAGGTKIGFLWLCAKPDEAAQVKRYAAMTGRLDDVKEIAPDSGEAFNFLEYEAERAAKLGLRLTDNLVSLFIELLSATQGQKSHSDTFWIDATKELMAAAFDLLQTTGGKVSLPTLCEVIESAPLTPEQADNEEWQESSYCYQLVTQGAKKFAGLKATLNNLPAKECERLQSEERDFKTAYDYWMVKFPQMDDRPRSGVLMMFSSMANMFRRGVMADLFCGKTTFTPEDIEQGKIVILSLPVLGVMRESGRMAQILFKFIFQRVIQSRDITTSPTPVVIFADEAHYFTSPNDVLFMTTARSSRVCTVYISQTLSNYREMLGNRGEVSADALLAGFQTKAFCCNGDDVTNQWASRLIGSVWTGKGSYSKGRSTQDMTPGASHNEGINVNEQLVAQIDAAHWTQLRKGGVSNNFYVDCVLFQPGKQWANGRNFIEITLNQKQINS